MGGFVATAFVAAARRPGGRHRAGRRRPAVRAGARGHHAGAGAQGGDRAGGPAADHDVRRPEAYLDFWRPHPALADAWSPDVEAYLTYDLDGDRSSVSLDAVRDDSADLLDADRAGARAATLPAGTVFLRAPAGMLGDPGGLYPAEAVEEHARSWPGLVTRDVPGTNHYTIVMGETGARAVADALDEVG